MKKLLIIASFAMMGTTALQAQEFKFGPKAGYSLSMLKAKSDNQTINADAKSSFYAGGFVEYKFNDKVAVMGELLYSQIGGKADQSASGSVDGVSVSANSSVDYKFGNLQIPLSAKYFATENFAFGVGLNVGIITSAEAEYSVSGSVSGNGQNVSATESGTQDIKEYVNSVNLAPFVGAEYTLENGLFFDARYNLGVSNMSKDSQNNESVKTSFFQVGIGFKFGGN